MDWFRSKTCLPEDRSVMIGVEVERNTNPKDSDFGAIRLNVEVQVCGWVVYRGDSIDDAIFAAEKANSVLEQQNKEVNSLVQTVKSRFNAAGFSLLPSDR